MGNFINERDRDGSKGFMNMDDVFSSPAGPDYVPLAESDLVHPDLTLGDLSLVLQGLKNQGVTWESLNYVAERIWFDSFSSSRLTPAQETMRREMNETAQPAQPAKLSSVLDDLIGLAHVTDSDKMVADAALEIIAGHELSLSMKQWQIVQRMVEQGIQVGWVAGGSQPK